MPAAASPPEAADGAGRAGALAADGPVQLPAHGTGTHGTGAQPSPGAMVRYDTAHSSAGSAFSWLSAAPEPRQSPPGLRVAAEAAVAAAARAVAAAAAWQQPQQAAPRAAGGGAGRRPQPMEGLHPGLPTYLAEQQALLDEGGAEAAMHGLRAAGAAEAEGEAVGLATPGRGRGLAAAGLDHLHRLLGTASPERDGGSGGGSFRAAPRPAAAAAAAAQQLAAGGTPSPSPSAAARGPGSAASTPHWGPGPLDFTARYSGGRRPPAVALAAQHGEGGGGEAAASPDRERPALLGRPGSGSPWERQGSAPWDSSAQPVATIGSNVLALPSFGGGGGGGSGGAGGERASAGGSGRSFGREVGAGGAGASAAGLLLAAGPDGGPPGPARPGRFSVSGFSTLGSPHTTSGAGGAAAGAGVGRGVGGGGGSGGRDMTVFTNALFGSGRGGAAGGAAAHPAHHAPPPLAHGAGHPHVEGGEEGPPYDVAVRGGEGLPSPEPPRWGY
jgi:hypothetical protein